MPDGLASGLVVGSVWTSTRETTRRVERVVPNGGAQIVFDLDSGRGVLVGLRTVSAVVQPPARARGLRLTGAGVFAIVGSGVGATIDRAMDLDTLISPAELRQLHVDGVPEGALFELVVRLCSRFAPDPRVVTAEQELRRGHSAADLARLVRLDRRRLVPLFRRQIGISPKTYEQRMRLAAAITSLRTASSGSIAAVAVEHGYADQAHLTRAVRTLAARTPGMLSRLPAGPVTHLPVDDTAH